MFLLQQPEVHLHPTAQAALGSLFCEIAGWDRQIIVETHSDYIIDRVRMDVRDNKTDLKPADVSILYFETGRAGGQDPLAGSWTSTETSLRILRLDTASSSWTKCGAP